MVKLTLKHHSEAGVVLPMLFILTGIFTGSILHFKLAFGALLLDLAVPKIFWPFTFIWFNLSQVLGFVMSRIILSLIFVLLIVPVSFFRKLAGKDTLLLKGFKKSSGSVFNERNITFTDKDLEKTY